MVVSYGILLNEPSVSLTATLMRRPDGRKVVKMFCSILNILR